MGLTVSWDISPLGKTRRVRVTHEHLWGVNIYFRPEIKQSRLFFGKAVTERTITSYGKVRAQCPGMWGNTSAKFQADSLRGKAGSPGWSLSAPARAFEDAAESMTFANKRQY